VVVLDLDLAGVMLVADVAGGIVGAPTGEGGRRATDDERAGDRGGGDETTKIHWTLPIACDRVFIGGRRREQHPSIVLGPRYRRNVRL